MTQEEKARAYDEVREKIAIRFGSNVAEEIFSQFEMSEDERIRKALIKVFASHKDYEVFFCVSVEDILAWLEKHGKQKPAELPKGEDYGIDGLYAAVDILKKTLGKVDGYQTDDGILEHKCAINAVKELSKQKPADTEKGAKGNDREIPISEPPLTIKHAREVMGIKQNPAWSEEDERFLNVAINILNSSKVYTKSPDKYEDTIDWLKSLKERYTWKSSDEQIKVCKEVYADILSAKGFDLGTVNGELNRLEEELKKLREE